MMVGSYYKSKGFLEDREGKLIQISYQTYNITKIQRRDYVRVNMVQIITILMSCEIDNEEEDRKRHYCLLLD